jgi:hypothetical protein
MTKLNPSNERIKRYYCRWLKAAQGKSEATLDEVRNALATLTSYGKLSPHRQVRSSGPSCWRHPSRTLRCSPSCALSLTVVEGEYPSQGQLGKMPTSSVCRLDEEVFGVAA